MLICLKRSISGHIGLYVIVLVLICFSTSAFAQSDNALSSGADSIQELVEQGNDLLPEKYEGVAREYGGYRKSPNLFGRNSSGGSRHPDLNQYSMEVGLNPAVAERAGIFYGGTWAIPTLSPPLDLSVDDEITKSAIPQFRLISRSSPGGGKGSMHEEFMADEWLRDEYLDIFKTTRGIAELTLSYLDKTVAAGLATAKQQGDMDTMQQMLKQINHSMAKVANPEQSRLYDDLDEKFDACMNGVGSGNPPPAAGDRPTPVIFDAVAICQLRTPGSTFCGGPPRYQSSPYAFCMCCAESSNFANLSTETTGSSTGVLYNQGFSLVDRIFMGLKVPAGRLRVEHDPDAVTSTVVSATPTTTIDFQKPSPGGYNAGAAMIEFSGMVRAVYGDLLYTEKRSNPINVTAADTRTTGAMAGKTTIKFTSPLLSVQQWVRALRDFEHIKQIYPYAGALDFSRGVPGATTDSCHWETNEGMWLRYCSALGTAMKWGICPSINNLIKYEKDNTLTALADGTYTGSLAVPTGYANWPQAIIQMWSEASMGGVLLSRADVTAMAEISDTNEGQRLIAAFCDTSAVEAFRRLHRKVHSLANDMLAANRKTTKAEKEQFVSLMQRVDDQLIAGKEDSYSKVDDIILALEMQKDRKREALRSSLVATGNAAERRARRVGGLFHNFGGAFPR